MASSSSSRSSLGGIGNKVIQFNGEDYSIEMTWKYLEFLSTRLPEQFGCVSSVKGRDIKTLEELLKSIEATTSVHRSQIFTQVANAMARNHQNVGNKQQTQHQQQLTQQQPSHQQSSQQQSPHQLQTQHQQHQQLRMQQAPTITQVSMIT